MLCPHLHHDQSTQGLAARSAKIQRGQAPAYRAFLGAGLAALARRAEPTTFGYFGP